MPQNDSDVSLRDFLLKLIQQYETAHVEKHELEYRALLLAQAQMEARLLNANHLKERLQDYVTIADYRVLLARVDALDKLVERGIGAVAVIGVLVALFQIALKFF